MKRTTPARPSKVALTIAHQRAQERRARYETVVRAAAPRRIIDGYQPWIAATRFARVPR